MKKLRNKIVSLLAAGALSFSLIMPVCAAAPSSANVITISTAEEFIDFAKNCSLDKWSQGKTVTLAADINLSGTGFEPVPIFGGTFDGAGHTINGLRIDSMGSHKGLFRYLEKSAVVSDLNVIGTVSPTGSRSEIGGIAGVNLGTIRNCTFGGTVSGESDIGGIVGSNEETGSVIGCSVSGIIYGKSSVGGIAGRSEGTLLKCENSAGVNITNPDASDGMTDLDPGAAIDWYESPADEEANLLNSYSDSGGIVGCSSGIVQSCVNTGNVGYPHVGYNIGGVAGRQSGYLAGCKNSGTINGRKEVGGIVGQSEPYLTLEPGKETLENLRTELHTLGDLIDKTLNDVQGTGDDVSERLSNMKKYADAATDSCDAMLNEVTDFVDGNVDIINSVTADVTNALDKIAPAMDELAEVGSSISEMSDDLSGAMDYLKDVADVGDSAMTELKAALDKMKTASDDLNKAAKSFKEAVEALTDGVVSGDDEDMAAASDNLGNAADKLGGALENMDGAAEELDRALADAGLAEGGASSNSGDNAENPAAPENPAVSEAPDAPNVSENPETPENPEAPTEPEEPARPSLPIDPDDFDNDLDEIIDTVRDNWEKAKDPLKDSADSMEKAAESLNAAFEKLQSAAEKLDPVSDDVNNALDNFEDAADAASSIGKSLESAFTSFGDAVRVLTEDGPKEFLRLGDDFRNAGNTLQGSVSSITDDLEALNRQLNENSGVVADDLRAINDQLRVISDMVIDAAADIEDTASNPSVGDSYQDTSDEDIAATRQGKVTDCENSGEVTGDRNVGGIVGAMAIEFDLDPEGDLSEEMRFGATYETKSVLQNSKNYGLITAKKDCTGGIVGRMELGTALGCQNYGEVVGGSNYAGGIAGYSDAVVRGCFAKCVLSGGSYIGGVTGWAKNLRDCYAIATVKEGDEYVGALSGSVKEDGVLTGNRFVDTGTAGVDGISYADRADPIGFEELLKTEGVPKEFTTFSIILKADDKIVETIPFNYGDDLSKITLPDVPEQNGSFGKWAEFDTTGLMSDVTVEAVYAPWITIAASEEQHNKLALALAEGRFTDDVLLRAEDSTATPPITSSADAKVLKISLTGTQLGDTDTIPIRLLNVGGGSASVWRLDNGSWQSVSFEKSGQYLLLEMTGTENTFCIQPHQTDIMPILIIAAAAVVVIVIIILIVKAVKKKKTKSKVTNK